MYPDDHRGWYAGLREELAPLRKPLTVTGKDDCFGWGRWDVHRDLPATVVVECFGDELARGCAGPLARRSVGLALHPTALLSRDSTVAPNTALAPRSKRTARASSRAPASARLSISLGSGYAAPRRDARNGTFRPPCS